MGMTEYGSNVLLNAITGVATPPGTLYLALLLQEPTENSSGSTLAEPIDAEYVRQTIVMDDTHWEAADSGYATYIDSITYPTASVDWVNISWWALCTASTAGSVILWGEFDVTQTVDAGSEVVIPAGSFGLFLAAPETAVVT